MNLRLLPTLAALLAAMTLSSLPAPALAGTIEFNAPVPGKTGAADLTFYYDSVANTWATTFQAKGTAGQPTTTNATGLTAPFTSGPPASTPAPWTGILGNTVPTAAGNTGDYTFTSLTTNIATATQQAVTTSGTTTSYYVASASGSTINPATPTADLGIRTRLREDQVAMGTGTNATANQFDTFNLTLRLADSTFNGNPLGSSGAFVSLLNYSGTNSEALIDSAANQLTANFSNWAHVHRNWGFSQYGTYSLAFDLQGVGGTYGPTAGVGTTTLGFVAAVPEPGTVSLAALGLVCAAGGLYRLRRREPATDSAIPSEEFVG
jgi:surface-anchored protein